MLRLFFANALGELGDVHTVAPSKIPALGRLLRRDGLN